MPLTAYQRRLIFFLSVATFFEGYDFFAIAQILPSIRATFGLTPGQGGLLIAVSQAGTVLAYLIVRKADQWGRRRVLNLTIVGYTLCSLLSGIAPHAALFAVAQLGARMFLIGEWAVAMIYAAEDFPAERRALVIGVIQACASLGAITCAGIVPLLLKSPLGWRGVYFIGAVPLGLIAYARRDIQETARFVARGPIVLKATNFTRIFRTPYRKRLLQVGLLWALTYACTQNAMVFWKEFAITERGFTDADVARAMTLGALGAMPFAFYAGRLLDVVGRRAGAVVLFTLCTVGVVSSYTLHGRLWLTLALGVGIVGTQAVLPVLNAYTAELFPTELRSDAFAWANNLIGRALCLPTPALIGCAAATLGWGPSVAATALGPAVALGLILLLMPETRGQELEETSRLH